MLFTYPTEALACNWLNANVIAALIGGMDAIDEGNNPLPWPNHLPASKREILRTRTGLRPKLEAFWTEYTDLEAAEKASIRESISQQTNIPNIFSDCEIICLGSDELPESMCEPVKALADYLFRQLGTISVGGKVLRDIQFEISQENGVRICPFCGLDYFQPIGLKRNALDHLMPISRYPFVAADFRNLPPTCHPCNSLYKIDKDVLLDNLGHRRPCSDPYVGPIFRVALEGSTYGNGKTSRGYRLPKWQISLVGESIQQAETWDALYQIKSRYEVTLDTDFLSWVKHYALWFVREFGREKTADEVSSMLPRYIENVVQEGFADRAFLKSEVFCFLNRSCHDGAVGNEVKEWLCDQVKFAT